METRRIWTTEAIDWYDRKSGWAGLRSFVCVESIRTIAGENSTDRRYYVSDLGGKACLNEDYLLRLLTQGI